MIVIKNHKNRHLVGALLILALMLTLGLAITTSAQADDSIMTLSVKDSEGNPLDGVPISYNDYGSHYVDLGTTSAGQVVATLPDGNYLFRAIKDTSVQYENGTVPGTVRFQTSKFIVHVDDSDGNDYPGIAASYNDYGSHYISMGNTDANGEACIELFPGNYRFKAYKDHTQQTGYLEVATSGTSGTIDFQTAQFVVHVMKSDGSNYQGIAASFNDYGNHYLSMGPTDISGNASIELFLGNYKFKASKDHTEQMGYLEVDTSGTSGTIDFQTALAEGFARDCDIGDPIQGIKISFNDYGNHWLSMGTTGTDGKASIELFPGTNYKFQGYTQHTQQVKTVDLPSTGVVIEFNPTRICFIYPGSVKFNDYGNHWQHVPCNMYLFPGTYYFEFTGSEGTSYEWIGVSGCAMIVPYPDTNTPPVCDIAMPTIDILWPPNHIMVLVDLLGVTDPDGDPVTITIDSIFQDEPVNGKGDGNTAPDGSGVGTPTAMVRAERAGGGNGRVYHIIFTADDGRGGTCSGEILVSVPKSMGKKGSAVDDGPLYDSTIIQ